VVSLATTYTDVAGNTGTAATSPNYKIDTKAPTATITLSDTALKVGETAVVAITFSEVVSGLNASDFIIPNGTLSEPIGSDGGRVWTATFTPAANIADTTNVIVLKTDAVLDGAGNPNTTTASSPNFDINTVAAGAFYQLTTTDIQGLASDTAFDNFVSSKIDLGFQGIELDVEDVVALGAKGGVFDFADGTDVLVTGTGFLGAPGAATLLAGADVDVKLSTSDLNEILAANSSTNDTSFDTLINSLEASGMDRLVLDVAQVEALGLDGITIDSGTDVLVTGTGFLGAPGTANLLAAADVDVKLTDSDLNWILSAGTGLSGTAASTAIDARLDSLVDSLRASGMDRLVLGSAQVETLAAVPGVDFEFGNGDYGVLVTGTGFLGSTGVTTLLGGVNVDVQLSTFDINNLLDATAPQAALNSLVSAVNALDAGSLAIGDARIALDIAAVEALAGAGLDFTSAADVVVTGTGFLGTTGALGTSVNELLDDAQLTVAFDSSDATYLGSFASAVSLDAAIDSIETKMDAFDVDTLQFSSGDLAGMVDALSDSLGLTSFDGFSVASGIDEVLVTGTGFLDQGSDAHDNLFDAYDLPNNADGVDLDEQIVKLLGNN
jgi:hypothetical protein